MSSARGSRATGGGAIEMNGYPSMVADEPAPLHLDVYVSRDKSLEEAGNAKQRYSVKFQILFLLIGFASGFFYQYQPVGLCVFTFHFSLLGFLWVSDPKWWLRWLGLVFIGLGLSLSMPQLFNSHNGDPTGPYWDWTSWGIVIGIDQAFVYVLGLCAWMHVRLAKKLEGKYVLFCYPTLSSAVYSLMSKTLPFGTTLNFGYGLYEWLSFIQIVSVIGVIGLDFVIVLISTSALHTMVVDKGRSSRHKNVSNEFDIRKKYSLRVFIGTVVLVWSFGSIRLLWPYLYQQQVQDIAVPSEDWIFGACVVWEPDQGVDPVQQTVDVLASDSSIKFVIWSESAGDYAYYDDTGSLANSLEDWQIPRLSDLKTQLANISSTQNVTIAATFSTWAYPEEYTNNEVFNNMLVMDPVKGQVLMYSKRHPVTLIEDSVVASQDNYPGGSSTILGDFNAAICFDFEFPDFIREGTSSGLFLEPANTWGIISIVETVADNFRAIENGAYIVRCSSNGVSGVWDYNGTPLMQQIRADVGIVKFQIPADHPRVWTFYSHAGFAFDYILYAASFVFFTLVFITRKKKWVDDMNYINTGRAASMQTPGQSPPI